MSSGNTLQKRPTRRKIFTVDEANAMLPLVRAIASDLAEVSREVIERRQRLSLLSGGKQTKPDDPYREELVQIEKELGKDTRRLREYVQELRHLGVEPVSGSEGVIDFPAIIEGQKGFLSWKLGESQVLHWHEIHNGYSERKPLLPKSRSMTTMTGCKTPGIA